MAGPIFSKITKDHWYKLHVTCTEFHPNRIVLIFNMYFQQKLCQSVGNKRVYVYQMHGRYTVKTTGLWRWCIAHWHYLQGETCQWILNFGFVFHLHDTKDSFKRNNYLRNKRSYWWHKTLYIYTHPVMRKRHLRFI